MEWRGIPTEKKFLILGLAHHQTLLLKGAKGKTGRRGPSPAI
jgi:hypothetical protein